MRKSAGIILTAIASIGLVATGYAATQAPGNAHFLDFLGGLDFYRHGLAVRPKRAREDMPSEPMRQM